MKKYLIMLLFVSSVVFAENDFHIDINSFDFTNKSNYLIDKLDSEYKIDTKGFVSTEVVDKKAKEYTKKIIDIIFSENIDRDLHAEQYRGSGNETITSLAMINLFITDFTKLNIEYKYIKLIRTIEFEGGTITLSYFPNVEIDGEKQDFIIVLYLKEVNGEYKVYMPWFTKGNDLEEYFKNLGNKEEQNEIIGGSFKNISLDSNNALVSDESLKELFNNNVNKNVSISALYDGDTNVYASGFYLRKGIVATTWYTFLDILNNSEFIYVNDNDKNTYKIDGIVAANSNYDIVLLKLEKEVGEEVEISDTKINPKDVILTINSKSNNNFVINYGTNLSYYNGKYKNMFALSSEDVGSAIYNIEGKVVGFNTSNSLNNEVSIANNAYNLIELQKVLNNKSFNSIKSISFKEFKENYYNKDNKELVVNDIPSNIWNKFNKVGKIEENIDLELIKANYSNNIISLRYKNDIYKQFNSFYLISTYEEELLKEGYKLDYDNATKKVYVGDNYKVIIKECLNYLLIIIMENK